jgi:hypothetical protein
VGNEFDFIRTLHEELDRKQNPAIGPHLEFAGVIDGTARPLSARSLRTLQSRLSNGSSGTKPQAPARSRYTAP